jgi:TRAP-type mannitol/chloroaromatic compound transport system substrate-binding protein
MRTATTNNLCRIFFLVIITLFLTNPKELSAGNPRIKLKMPLAFRLDTPILGTSAKRLAKELRSQSRGKIKVKLYEPGQLMATSQILDAVGRGEVNAGWGIAMFWNRKNSAFTMFTGIPFGLSVREHYNWYLKGGMRRYYEDLYARYNVKAIPAGMMGAEGVWFRRPIANISDFKGLKIRYMGYGVQVMQKLGADVRLIPGGEIVQAFVQNKIDAAEFSTPYLDERLGLHKYAKNYYYPSWHQPSSMVDLYINLDYWQKLPKSQQKLIEQVCHNNVLFGIAEHERLTQKALYNLRRKGVSIREFPSDVLYHLKNAWVEVAKEESYKNHDISMIYSAYRSFQENQLVSANVPQPTQKKITKIFDKEPPKIVITSHNTRGIVPIVKGMKTTVTGKVTDRSGVVQVIVDNKDAFLDEDGNFSADVYLKVGQNKVTVSAMDRYENKASKAFTIIRKSSSLAHTTTKPQESPGLRSWYEKQYAIVIGIDQYYNKTIDSLQNAVNDARSVSKLLIKMGFDLVELYDNRATKKQIIRSFSLITKKVKRNDSFLFYFAGHGQGFTLENGERVGYIIPYDANVSLIEKDIIEYDTEAIPLNTIKKYSKNIKAKHVALLFDSCFSGLVMKRSLPDLEKVDIDYYNDLLSRRVINILTAGDDQPVSDGSGHSPFTRAILNGLGTKGLDINDRDGLATFSQLAVYVKEKVGKATGRRQRPQFDNLSMEDGDFIFKLE